MIKNTFENWEEEIRKACSESKSMAEAATKVPIHFNTFKRYAVKLGIYNPNQSGIGITRKRNKVSLTKILNGEHPQYQSYKLKSRLIEEGYKKQECERCGLKEWLEKPISLELHHKDGNSSNHVLSNLELLCPNCHAFTENYRAKNIKCRD